MTQFLWHKYYKLFHNYDLRVIAATVMRRNGHERSCDEPEQTHACDCGCLVFALVFGLNGRAIATSADQAPAEAAPTQFVPNSLDYWSARDHWTTKYGPAFATIIEETSNSVSQMARELRAHRQLRPAASSVDANVCKMPQLEFYGT